MPEPIQLAIPKNMKVYPLAFLLPGPRFAELSDKTVPENQELQARHLLAVKGNVEAGTQLFAVPILTPDSPISALAVFRPDLPPEQLSALLEDDPAIAAGRFVFQIVSAFFPSLEDVRVIY